MHAKTTSMKDLTLISTNMMVKTNKHTYIITYSISIDISSIETRSDFACCNFHYGACIFNNKVDKEQFMN